MSELSIEEIERNTDIEIFEEMHYHTTIHNVVALCLKHGTDNILDNIKEYLALEVDKVC